MTVGWLFAHPVSPPPPPPANSGQCCPSCAAIKPFPQPSPKKGRCSPAQQRHRLVPAKICLFDLPAHVGMHERYREKNNTCERAPRRSHNGLVSLASYPSQNMSPTSCLTRPVLPALALHTRRSPRLTNTPCPACGGQRTTVNTERNMCDTRLRANIPCLDILRLEEPSVSNRGILLKSA